MIEKIEVSDGRVNNGGARPGAGRKPLAETLRKKANAEMRETFNRMVDAEWADIVGCLIKSAKRNPDAAKYLIDQRIGKPAQVLVGEDGGSVKFEVILTHASDSSPAAE